MSQRSLKVILMGDASVGKTSLRSQFVHHVFSSSYRATIGGDYLTATVNNTLLQIWDTAGQERFNSISKTFYRGSDIAIFVYDLTNLVTFQHLGRWINDFLENCHVLKPGIVIVGNKLDKLNLRQISLRQAREFASTNINLVDLIEDLKLDVIELSAKNLAEVELLFNRVVELGSAKMNQFDDILEYDNVDITTPSRKYGCC